MFCLHQKKKKTFKRHRARKQRPAPVVWWLPGAPIGAMPCGSLVFHPLAIHPHSLIAPSTNIPATSRSNAGATARPARARSPATETRPHSATNGCSCKVRKCVSTSGGRQAQQARAGGEPGPPLHIAQRLLSTPPPEVCDALERDAVGAAAADCAAVRGADAGDHVWPVELKARVLEPRVPAKTRSVVHLQAMHDGGHVDSVCVSARTMHPHGAYVQTS